MATEITRIGVTQGDSRYQFGRISAVGLGAEGNVFVLDAQSAQLNAYAQDGAHRFTFGRSGSGPGEFKDPRGLTVSPSGTLWVIDPPNGRLTEVTTDGELLGTFPRNGRSYGGYWGGTFGDDGIFYDVGTWVTESASGQTIVRHTLEATGPIPLDTFRLPEMRDSVFYIQAPAGILNLPIPYAARATWALDRQGRVWMGTGQEYRLVLVNLEAGDTALVLEVEKQRARVTAEDRAAAEDYLASVLDPMGAAGRVDPGRIPELHPAHGPLRVDTNGNLWAARPDMPDRNSGAVRTTFDVFDNQAKYVGYVTLDIDAHRPMAFADDLVAGVHLDGDGVSRVVLYRIAPPSS